MNSPITTYAHGRPSAGRAARCPAPSLASSRAAQTASPQHDPFAQRFGKPLPRELRLEADHMTWPAFESAYAPSNGPLQLAAWTEERINSSTSRYTAVLGIDHDTHKATAAASGPISAMTAILHENGYPIEITSFHQQLAGQQTATFIHCTSGERQHWAMGIGDNCTDSILHAFVCAANLLGDT